MVEGNNRDDRDDTDYRDDMDDRDDRDYGDDTEDRDDKGEVYKP